MNFNIAVSKNTNSPREAAAAVKQLWAQYCLRGSILHSHNGQKKDVTQKQQEIVRGQIIWKENDWSTCQYVHTLHFFSDADLRQ